MVSAYHARLPIGERLSPEPVLDSPFFPFEGDIRCRPLAEPIVPEPPRRGEPGGEPCEACAEPDKFAIWRDSQWILSAGFEPIGLPMVALLMPVEHVTLHTMPPSLAASLGTMIQRVAVAIGTIEGVGRVHYLAVDRRRQRALPHLVPGPPARPDADARRHARRLGRPPSRLPDEEFQANIRTVAAALDES